jgi:hypothetical protein
MIADVLESSTPELNRVPDLVPWEDGEEEAFRDGVAISIGDVVVIVSWYDRGSRRCKTVGVDGDTYVVAGVEVKDKKFDGDRNTFV